MTISTCNYVARNQGLSKMVHIKDALRIVPNLVVIPAHMELYRETSRNIFDSIRNICVQSVIEVSGIDEAFIDVTEWVKNRTLNDNVIGKSIPETFDENDANNVSIAIGSKIAQEIRDHVLNYCGYTMSAGISHNKFLAKIATSLHKPNNQTCIFRSGIRTVLDQLSLRRIPKIGRKLESKLKEIGLERICDVNDKVRKKLISAIGEKLAQYVMDMCRGQDDSAVVDKGTPKSITSELTFLPIDNLEQVREKLNIIADDLSQRILRDNERNARLPTKLVIKYSRADYQSSAITSKRQLGLTSDMNSQEMAHLITQLAISTLKFDSSIVRLGATVSEFEPSNDVKIDTFLKKRNVSEMDQNDLFTKSFQESLESRMNKRLKMREDKKNAKQSCLKIQCRLKQQSCLTSFMSKKV